MNDTIHQTTKLPRPDFGIDTIYVNGVPMTCRYVVPGLTMHDLMSIFERGQADPNNSPFSGNPSRWPKVAGMTAVVNAILDAIYEPEESNNG